MFYKKRNRRLALAAIAALFVLSLMLDPLNVTWHNRQLKKALTAVDAPTVSLNAVVPFAWDAVYTFDPYLSKEDMTEIIGFRCGALRESVSEGMVQLVFVKGRSVVASVCGYPDNLGYAVHFVTGDGEFAKLTFADDAAFSVEKADGVVHLRHIAGDA